MCKIGLNSITHLIIEEKRPGGADNYERTAGQESEDGPGGARDDQRLRDADGVLRLCRHEAAKGDSAG